MPRIYVAAGSNLGDRAQYLEQAGRYLQQLPVTSFQSSSVHETLPVGGPQQGKYLNAVWTFETGMDPEALLASLLEIERKLGRVRDVPNGPRTIDLDILFYGDSVLNKPGLTIPHPRLHERLFVLEPLSELAPDFIHPVLRETIQEVLKKNHETHQEA